MMMTVYVPREGASATARLAPRSAIVGGPADGGIDCHYEGAVYDQANLVRFHDRLSCAAGRRIQRYPTTARGRFPDDSLVPVADYDAVRGVVLSVGDAAALSAWSGETAEDVVGATLPPGRTAWTDAAVLAGAPGSRPIGTQRIGRVMLYRTQAGQVVHLDAMSHEAWVVSYDDEALPDLLARAGASEAERRMTIGT